MALFLSTDGFTQKAAGRQTRPGIDVHNQLTIERVSGQDEIKTEQQLSKSASCYSRAIAALLPLLPVIRA